MRQGRHLKIAGLVVASAISLLLASASTVSYYYQNRVMPNTIVAGVALGGKTIIQAQSIVIDRAKLLQTQPIELSLDEKRVKLSAEELGVKFDERAARAKIDHRSGFLDRLKPNYWQNFFQPKIISLDYDIDRSIAQKKIEEVFAITAKAKDAAVITNGEQLIVEPAAIGISINVAIIEQVINRLARLGRVETVRLKFVEQKPNISTEEANRIKDEIEVSLKPLYLTADNNRFIITKNDQYQFLTYVNDNGRLRWEFSQAAINDYLANNIARRLNVKMLPKTIMSDTGAITQEGRDGRQVNTRALTQAVYQALVSRVETESTPILIPIQTIPFSERIVHPDYITGLFEGRYIHINLAKQKLFLIDGTNKVGEYRVSTGKWNTPTPKGTLYIINKFESSAYSRTYNLWMPFWMGLSTNQNTSGYRGYGIHELPCFNQECTLREGQNHLGIPASHGCIRLGIGPAAEVFAWANVGTPVYIN